MTVSSPPPKIGYPSPAAARPWIATTFNLLLATIAWLLVLTSISTFSRRSFHPFVVIVSGLFVPIMVLGYHFLAARVLTIAVTAWSRRRTD